MIQRLIIATDAWAPQVNGVATTLGALVKELRDRGVAVEIVTPGDFPTVPLPTYRDIGLALARRRAIRHRIDMFRPDIVHIATEGPIGWATRAVCMERHMPFTTSYHTRFPEYVRRRVPVPVAWSYAVLRRFPGAAAGTMVSNRSIAKELRRRGFRNLMSWGRGVDLSRFSPDASPQAMPDVSRPIFLSVGRLAPEKSVEDFLSLDLPGTKVVVGDGPSADMLRQRFPKAVFLGTLPHRALAGIYAEADVFVFPSRTDTFGLVLIEAMACGTPVAAYPVAGPRDIVGDSGTGALSEDLRGAAMAALRIDRAICRAHAEGFTWEASASQFLANLETAAGKHAAAARPAPPRSAWSALTGWRRTPAPDRR
jgi:glycosyltransferase involved in cell wall biosynthesis